MRGSGAFWEMKLGWGVEKCCYFWGRVGRLWEVSSRLRSEWQLWEALGTITAGRRELLQEAQARHQFRGLELVKVTDMAESEWVKEVEITCQTCEA